MIRLKNNYRLYNVLKTIEPFGVINASDLTFAELYSIIHSIINSSPFYTRTIVDFLGKEMLNNSILDKIDRQILYELSLGSKMKDLPKLVPLSIAGIEKRKRKIKDFFKINSCCDRELLIAAKDHGFI